VPTFSLASFNSHYGVRIDRNLRPREPYDVTAALRSLDADVLVVQEVWRPDGVHGAFEDAADALGYEMEFVSFGRATVRARWPHSAPGGEGTTGIGLMTRLPLTRVGRIPLGPTPGDPVPGRAAFDVDLDVGGTSVRLIGVHLTSRLPFGPLHQLHKLSRAVPPAGTPTVIAGDCNFWGPGVRAALRGWRRAVRGQTWPARRPHSQIDHVLVRRGDVEVLDAQVLPDLGSDHRPIRVELRVGERAPTATEETAEP
jgi:endonuclease/exonuclease/phosphatase family metal-dependent hydrolase